MEDKEDYFYFNALISAVIGANMLVPKSRVWTLCQMLILLEWFQADVTIGTMLDFPQ